LIQLDWTTNPKITPKTISEMALYPDLKEELLFYEKNNNFGNLLMMGDTGTGKTTAARILGGRSAHEIDCAKIKSEGTKGAKTLKEWIVGSSTLSLEMVMEQGTTGNTKRVMILDEFHLLSTTLQSNLYKPIEDNTKTTRWIFCVNSEEKVEAPIKSRCDKVWFSSCILHPKTHKLIMDDTAGITQKEWQEELTRVGKIIEKKLDITIPDHIYEKVLSKDGNLIDARQFVRSLNKAYAMSLD